MNDISRTDISRHLAALADDLRRFETSEPLPWPVARMFNELLKQTKLQLGAHPLVNTMGSVKEAADADLHPGESNAGVGTVLAVVGQLRVALELDGDSEPHR